MRHVLVTHIVQIWRLVSMAFVLMQIIVLLLMMSSPLAINLQVHSLEIILFRIGLIRNLSIVNDLSISFISKGLRCLGVNNLVR